MADSTKTAYAAREAVACDAPDTVLTADRAKAPIGAAAVDLTDLAQRLGDRWALRGVTLRVEPGEVVGVVGPNGSGKTTLLRVITTSLTPTRGSGRVFGLDLVREADAVRELTGMLGHGTGLYDDLTVAENLAFTLRMCGAAPARSVIEGALDAVAMRPHAGERVRALSSGMRRRVALARLLLRRPRLLLLDEPYNTFDVSGVELVNELVRDTVSSGGAALVVTHDIDDIARRGGGRYDRFIALSAGRIAHAAADGRPARPAALPL